jgi:hypothetical protein
MFDDIHAKLLFNLAKDIGISELVPGIEQMNRFVITIADDTKNTKKSTTVGKFRLGRDELANLFDRKLQTLLNGGIDNGEDPSIIQYALIDYIKDPTTSPNFIPKGVIHPRKGTFTREYIDLYKRFINSDTNVNISKGIQWFQDRIPGKATGMTLKAMLYQMYNKKMAELKSNIKDIKFVKSLIEIHLGTFETSTAKYISPLFITVKGKKIQYDLFRAYNTFLHLTSVENVNTFMPPDLVNIIFESKEFAPILNNIADNVEFVDRIHNYYTSELSKLDGISNFHNKLLQRLVYVCPVCKKSFNSLVQQKKHAQKVHNIVPSVVDSSWKPLIAPIDSECMYCDAVDVTDAHLSIHTTTQQNVLEDITNSNSIKYLTYLHNNGFTNSPEDIDDNHFNMANYFINFCETRVRGDLSVLSHSFNKFGICVFCKWTRKQIIHEIKTSSVARLELHADKVQSQAIIITKAYSLMAIHSEMLNDQSSKISLNDLNMASSWELLRNIKHPPVSYIDNVVERITRYQDFFKRYFITGDKMLWSLITVNTKSDYFHGISNSTKNIYNSSTLPNMSRDYPAFSSKIRAEIFESPSIKKLNNEILEIQKNENMTVDNNKIIKNLRKKIFGIIGDNVFDSLSSMTGDKSVMASLTDSLITASDLIITQNELLDSALQVMDKRVIINTAKQLILLSRNNKQSYRLQN